MSVYTSTSLNDPLTGTQTAQFHRIGLGLRDWSHEQFQFNCPYKLFHTCVCLLDSTVSACVYFVCRCLCVRVRKCVNINVRDVMVILADDGRRPPWYSAFGNHRTHVLHTRSVCAASNRPACLEIGIQLISLWEIGWRCRRCPFRMFIYINIYKSLSMQCYGSMVYVATLKEGVGGFFLCVFIIVFSVAI